MELAIGRVPALATAGVNQMINGPESFTPDGNFILGEAPELKNFFVGAGFNAFGIAAGGGAGMALAEWVHRGQAPYDLWAVDIRRFGRPHHDTEWVRTRTLEAYAKHYTMAWPHEEHTSGRPCRVSPLYDRLRAAGACFGEKLGWERPNWFADRSLGEEPIDRYTYGRQNWFAAVGREHAAVRERAGVVRPDVVRQVRGEGPRCAGRARTGCAPTTSTSRSARSPTPSCSMTVAASRVISPSRGSRPTSSTSSPEPVSPPTTSTGSTATCDRAPTPNSSMSPRRTRCSRSSARGRGHPRPSHRCRPLERGLPVRQHAHRPHRRGVDPGAASHLRRGARLGAARSRRERIGGLRPAHGPPGRPTGW